MKVWEVVKLDNVSGVGARGGRSIDCSAGSFYSNIAVTGCSPTVSVKALLEYLPHA